MQSNIILNSRKVITVLIIMLFCTSLQAQEKLFESNSRSSCSIEEKYFDNYIFRFDGKDYNDNSEAFICLNELPINIEIREKNVENNPLVEAVNWNWSECSCEPDTPTGPKAQLVEFTEEKKVDIKVKFEVINSDNELEEISLKLKVISEYYVKFKDHNDAQFIFDAGKKKYPLNKSISMNGKPIKYIESSKSDKVKAEVKPGKAKSAISLTANSTIEFDPDFFNNSKIDLTINLSDINGKGFIAVNSCNHDLNIFHKDYEAEDIHMYLMCESDDDQQVNLGEVETADAICVEPGEDGTLDEYYFLELGEGTRWVDEDDEVKEINGVKYVIAGSKKNSNGKYECNTEARDNNIDCPNLPSNWNSILNEVKDFYVENASYELNFLPIETINRNYDSRVDNSIFTKDKETADFLESYYNGNFPEEPHFFIVKDAGGENDNTKGFGKNNFMVAETYSGSSMSLIVAHELGHALFNLKHPEDYPDITSDNKSFMMAKPNEDNGDKLSIKTVRAQQLIHIRN